MINHHTALGSLFPNYHNSSAEAVRAVHMSEADPADAGAGASSGAGADDIGESCAGKSNTIRRPAQHETAAGREQAADAGKLKSVDMGGNAGAGAGADAVARAVALAHAADPDLALLDSCIYSGGDMGPEELLEQAGLPADELHVEILQELLSRDIQPQKDIIETAASTAKKIEYIANNLTWEAATEAANMLLKEKLKPLSISGVSNSVRKIVTDKLTDAFQRLSYGEGGEGGGNVVVISRSSGEVSEPAGEFVAHTSDNPEIDLDTLYRIIVKIRSENDQNLSLSDIPAGYIHPSEIKDEAVRAAFESIDSDPADNREKAAVRMMLAFGVPISKTNLQTIIAYHDKIARLREVTPEAAAVALENGRDHMSTDALLAAAAYAGNINTANVDEKTLIGLEGQMQKLFERIGLAYESGNIRIAKALLKVGGGISAENVEVIDKLLTDVESVLSGNSEAFAALLLKKGIDPGKATVDLLADMQKLLDRMDKVRETETRSIIRGYNPDDYSDVYLRRGTGSGQAAGISDSELVKLEKRIVELLRNQSVEPSPEKIDAAKALIREGIEVNAANIDRFFAETDRLRSLGAVFESMERINDRGVRMELHEVDALIEHLEESGRLIRESSPQSDPRLGRIDSLVEMISRLRVRDFGAIAALMKHDMPITLKNLSAAYASRDKNIDIVLDAATDQNKDSVFIASLASARDKSIDIAKNAAIDQGVFAKVARASIISAMPVSTAGSVMSATPVSPAESTFYSTSASHAESTMPATLAYTATSVAFDTSVAANEQPTGEGQSIEQHTIEQPKEQPVAEQPKELQSAGQPKDQTVVGQPKEQPVAGQSKEQPSGELSKEASSNELPQGQSSAVQQQDQPPAVQLHVQSSSVQPLEQPAAKQPIEQPSGELPKEESSNELQQGQSSAVQPQDQPPVLQPQEHLTAGQPIEQQYGNLSQEKPSDKLSQEQSSVVQPQGQSSAVQPQDQAPDVQLHEQSTAVQLQEQPAVEQLKEHQSGELPKEESSNELQQEQLSTVQPQDQPSAESPQEQAVNALVGQGVPVTRLTVINMYLANAAVKKIASTAGNENLFTASLYLYDKGVAVENTSLLILPSLLDAAIDAVGKSNANDAYREAMRFKRDISVKTQDAFVSVDRKNASTAGSATQRRGQSENAQGGVTSGQAGSGNQKKADGALLEGYIEKTRIGKLAAERELETRQAPEAARGDVIIGDTASQGSARNVTDHNAAVTDRNIERSAVNMQPRSSRVHSDTFAADHTSARESGAGTTDTSGGRAAASGRDAAITAETRLQPDVDTLKTMPSFLDKLISRIFTSVELIKDMSPGQLAWLTRSGATATADGLAAARLIADNTFSFGAGLIELEEYLASQTGGQGGRAEYANHAGKTGYPHGTATTGNTTAQSGQFNNGLNTYAGTVFNSIAAGFGAGDLTAVGAAGNRNGNGAGTGFGESAGDNDASGGMTGGGDNNGAGAGAGGPGSFGGDNANASANANADAYRQALRDLADIRGGMLRSDLAALKNGADISDIYNELKIRLLALEDKFIRQSGGQDDTVAKIISSMKDNIRAQDQMNRGPVCFQIPFLYGQKPSSLTVYVFDRKKGGRDKKSGDALSVALNLETQSLGTVDIGMNISDKRVDLDITVQNRGIRNYLEGLTATLSDRVRDAGFNVGGISYSIRNAGTTKGSGAEAPGRVRRKAFKSNAEDIAAEDGVGGSGRRRGRGGAKASLLARQAGRVGVDIKI